MPFPPSFPTPRRKDIKISLSRDHMRRRTLSPETSRNPSSREEDARRRFRSRCLDRMNTDRRERLEARRAESIRRVLQEEWMEFADEASLDPEWLAQLETELIAEQDEEEYANLMNSEQEAFEAEVAMYEQQRDTPSLPPPQASQLSMEHSRECHGAVLWTWDTAIGWIMLCDSCDICLAL